MSLVRIPCTVMRYGCVWVVYVAVFLLSAPVMATGSGYALKLDLQGVKGELADNIKATLSLRDELGEVLSRQRLQRLYVLAQDEALQALRPLGYYQAQLTPSLEWGEGRATIHLRIDPGAPVKVRHISLSWSGAAEQDPAVASLLASFPLSTGSVLRHDVYEQAKAAWWSLAYARGYFQAALVKHRIAVDPEQNVADIMLTMQAGPRHRMGAVRFVNPEYDADYLARYLDFTPDQSPYLIDHLFRLQEDLLGTDHFSRVDVRPLVQEAVKQNVPIVVETQARKRYHLQTGLGYGTDTGPRLRLKFQDRRLNRKGDHASLTAQLSRPKQKLELALIQPGRKPQSDQDRYDASWQREHNANRDWLSWQFGYGHSFLWRHGWTLTPYWRYLQERFRVGDSRDQVRLVMPGASVGRVRADDLLSTKHGFSIWLDVKGAHHRLLSDVDMLALRVKGKLVQRLSSRWTVLLRGDYGRLLSREYTRIPASLRFFTGGDRSVRGFAYQSLSPHDAQGNATGGRMLLVGSTELHLHVSHDWSLAGFMDTGGAINHEQDALEQSAGGGVVWRSPVGPIRFYLAWVLSQAGHPWRIHLVIGPDL